VSIRRRMAWPCDAVPTGLVNILIVIVRIARYRSWPGWCRISQRSLEVNRMGDILARAGRAAQFQPDR
jgi:hypothetical protein